MLFWVRSGLGLGPNQSPNHSPPIPQPSPSLGRAAGARKGGGETVVTVLGSHVAVSGSRVAAFDRKLTFVESRCDGLEMCYWRIVVFCVGLPICLFGCVSHLILFVVWGGGRRTSFWNLPIREDAKITTYTARAVGHRADIIPLLQDLLGNPTRIPCVAPCAGIACVLFALISRGCR